MRSTWGSGGSYQGGSWLPFSWFNIPVTRALIIATVVTFLAYFFSGQSGGVVFRTLAYVTVGPGDGAWYTRPWTWFTHPFVEDHPLWMLFRLYWLYVVGGILERSWGSRNFAVLFFAFSWIAAWAFLPAYYLLGKNASLGGLFLLTSILTVAWAAMDPEMEMSFWGIPLKLKALALLDVLLVYFYFGMEYRDPVLALFTLAGPAAAWFYVRKLPRLSLGFRAPARRAAPLLREEPAQRERVSGVNPLRKIQEQREIERLRKLLGEDDDRPTTRR